MERLLVLIPLLCFMLSSASARPRVLVVASRAKDHFAMIAAARPVLQEMAEREGFELAFTDDATTINDTNLAEYDAFVMLHLAPFDMTPDQQAALQRFIEKGGGWIGIHAAGLTGREFLDPEAAYWDWFESFIGSITYSPHPHYQIGTAMVEDRKHPITEGLPERFDMGDEWYEFNQSPRAHVHVLVTADESSYRQNHPMGDHPMVWVNERYRRMVYLALGHYPTCLTNKDYLRLLRNSIVWAVSK